MGLGIWYYSKAIEFVGDDPYDYVDHACNPVVFKYQLGSFILDKIYTRSEDSIEGSFNAGSYSGYNTWRNQLAIMAGYDSADEVFKSFDSESRLLKLKKLNGDEVKMKPFYELIYFSDCEGIIGPEICKKLYQDFVDFDNKAKTYSKANYDSYRNTYFYDKYLEWKDAFEVASDNGLVSFH